MKSTQNAKPRHETHSDARVVMVRPLVVTAGGSMSHAPIQAARLVMAGNPKPIIEGLPGYSPIIIKLDWPDMSIPDMSISDWKWLTGRIRSLHRPLHVSCAMGHGRTGSCLAILAHFWGQIPRKGDPVAWVRDNYCPEAIETKSQIAYIERITGRPSKCKAKEPVMVGTGYTGQNEWGQPYGWKSDKPSSYFPENDASKYALEAESRRRASKALATGQYADEYSTTARVRWCGQPTKGILCPKPAREGSILCDVHYMEAHPIAPLTAPETEPNPHREGA